MNMCPVFSTMKIQSVGPGCKIFFELAEIGHNVAEIGQLNCA